MLGGADNSNGELQSYIIGANKAFFIFRQCLIGPGFTAILCSILWT